MMIIHTNAPVNQPAYLEDRDGAPVPIEAATSYRCQIKRAVDDQDVILTFETGGNTGVIEVFTGELDGMVRDYFQFEAGLEFVIALEPGVYRADLIRIANNPDWIMGFDVIVRKGIAEP